MAKSRRNSRKRTKEAPKKHELPGGFWRQVIAVLMVAVAIMLVMTWFGEGGNLLNIIHVGANGLLGYAEYLIPLLLAYLAVMIFRSDDNRLPVAVWIASILMIFWIAGIAGLPAEGENQTGGLLGTWLNSLATQFLDKGVAVFIYIVLIFITAIFILQISPAAVFRGIGGVFRGTKKKEDEENLKLARAAESKADGD